MLAGIRQPMGPDLSSCGLTGKIAAAGYTGTGSSGLGAEATFPV